MELSQLRYFIAVAKLGNMSKAAETLFVSQPNLSTSISRLEEEVGVPLFERRRGKIALNQNGELLLKSVEQAVSLLDAGVQAVRNQHSGRPEPLSIVCMTDDTTLLEHFLLEHPEVNLIHQRAVSKCCFCCSSRTPVAIIYHWIFLLYHGLFKAPDQV